MGDIVTGRRRGIAVIWVYCDGRPKDLHRVSEFMAHDLTMPLADLSHRASVALLLYPLIKDLHTADLSGGLSKRIRD